MYPLGKREKRLVSNIQELLVVFDHILADTHSNDPSPDEANTTEDIVCDIFQGFFECRTCVAVDSDSAEWVRTENGINTRA